MLGRPTNEAENYFAFGFQTDKDTAASTFTFLRHLDGTGAAFETQVESVREGGDGQEVGLRYKTAINFDGSMVQNARPEAGARSAFAAFGADEVSIPAGDFASASGAANIHTLIPTHSVPPVTVEQRWADQCERGLNVRTTSLAIEWEQGRPIKLTNEFLTGGSVSRKPVASALTPTRETGQPFMYPGASVTITGASGAKMTKGKITIGRALDGDIRTNGLNREDVVALNFDAQVEGTLKYEDKELYDKVQYGSGSQVPFDLATGALTIHSRFGSGAQIRFLQAGVNNFDFTNTRVNGLDPDGKTMYIDFTAESRKSATHAAYVQVLIASAAKFTSGA